MIKFKKSNIIILLALLAAACIPACSFGDDNSGEAGMPDTSTIERRKEALKEAVDEPRALGDEDVSAITVRMWPQFVLHADSDKNVFEFEALNDEARKFKKETKKLWKGKSCTKALRSLIEEAVIKGYISDNNPHIGLEIYGMSTDRIGEEREGIEDILKLHDITADIEITEKGENDPKDK